MRIIELIIGLINILAVYCLTAKGLSKKYQFLGIIFGTISQVCWVALFTYTGQWGIIPVDLVLLYLYGTRLLTKCSCNKPCGKGKC